MYIKNILEKDIENIDDLEQRVNKVSEIVRLKFKFSKTKLMKQQVQKVIDSQKLLNQIKKDLAEVILIFERRSSSSSSITFNEIEELLSKLGKSLILLEIDVSGELVLNYYKNKKKITDLRYQYIFLNQTVETLIQEATRRG